MGRAHGQRRQLPAIVSTSRRCRVRPSVRSGVDLGDLGDGQRVDDGFAELSGRRTHSVGLRVAQQPSPLLPNFAERITGLGELLCCQIAPGKKGQSWAEYGRGPGEGPLQYGRIVVGKTLTQRCKQLRKHRWARTANLLGKPKSMSAQIRLLAVKQLDDAWRDTAHLVC